MKVNSFAKLPKKLEKRLYPGRFRWWLGPKCPSCKGTGRADDHEKCQWCEGSGRVGFLAKIYNWWCLDTPLALPSRFFPNKGVENEYTWEDWERDTKKKHPIRYFFQKSVPQRFRWHVTGPIGRAYWWVRHRTTNRYHILDFSDAKNGYHRGWQDRDHAILLASFKLFCQFMEIEAQYVGWEATEQHATAKKELDALYHWWTVERPAEREKLGYNDDELEKKDNEMLHKLIDLRGYLWS